MSTWRVALGVLMMLAAAVGHADQQPGRPPRDTGAQRPQQFASGAIVGRVTAAESGAPIRRAMVVAVSPDRMDPRTAFTDDEGRFQLAGLEPGRWQVTASKLGFATQKSGQRRPFDPEQQVVVDGGAVAEADFMLVRAGAVNGRIYDEYGDPLAAVRVHVLRARMIRQRRYLQRIGDGDLTDDTGAYRVYGLPPGEYYVTASLRVAPVDSVVQSTYAPTYYPGTGSFAEAQRVVLEPGAEVNVDFPVLPFRTARVSGTVLTASGSPGDAFLNLTSDAGELGVPLGVGGATREDGTFTLPDVPPGVYTLNATLKGGNTVGAEVAAIPLTVYGDDISGLTLVTARPGTMRGVIAADSGVTRRLPADVSIVARSARAGAEATYAEVTRNTFELTVPTGPIHLQVEPPDGWVVKAIVVNDIDATDAILDINGEQDVPVRVILTDRVTQVTGVVQGAQPPAAVVVFADDSARWTPPSRFVRTAAVDERGAFRIPGLPPAARYLAVAVDALEDGEGDDPDFLARVRDHGIAFALSDGERHVLDLKVIQR